MPASVILGKKTRETPAGKPSYNFRFAGRKKREKKKEIGIKKGIGGRVKTRKNWETQSFNNSSYEIMGIVKKMMTAEYRGQRGESNHPQKR